MFNEDEFINEMKDWLAQGYPEGVAEPAAAETAKRYCDLVGETDCLDLSTAAIAINEYNARLEKARTGTLRVQLGAECDSLVATECNYGTYCAVRECLGNGGRAFVLDIDGAEVVVPAKNVTYTVWSPNHVTE